MGFATWVLVGTSSLSIIFLILFKEDYKRLAFEKGSEHGGALKVEEVKVDEVKVDKGPSPVNP